MKLLHLEISCFQGYFLSIVMDVNLNGKMWRGQIVGYSNAPKKDLAGSVSCWGWWAEGADGLDIYQAKDSYFNETHVVQVWLAVKAKFVSWALQRKSIGPLNVLFIYLFVYRIYTAAHFTEKQFWAPPKDRYSSQYKKNR